jgi:hypothetical protein
MFHHRGQAALGKKVLIGVVIVALFVTERMEMRRAKNLVEDRPRRDRTKGKRYPAWWVLPWVLYGFIGHIH